MKPAEETATLLRALKQLDTLDMDKLFASGIDVTIHHYTHEDREHMERVSLHAEFFAPVRDALRTALRLSIERRKESLQRQLRDIDITTGLSGG